MFNIEEKLMVILNNYYGEQRDDQHKKEIADFIEAQADVIFYVLKEFIEE